MNHLFTALIMKTILIVAAVVLSFSALAAVPEKFEVTAPRFTEVVKCEAETGVNIRKTPSATAPRAVYNEAKIEDYDVPVQYYTYWSSGKTGGSIIADKFTRIAPLVSETKGWYEIYGRGPVMNETFQNGWVSAQYCTKSEIRPITISVINENAQNLRSVGNDMVIYYVADMMNDEYSFYIGKLTEGQLVCPYLFSISGIEETSGETCFKANEYGVMLMYCNSSEKDFEGPVLEKLSDATIRQILNHAVKAPASLTVFFDGSYLGTY